MCFRLVLYVDLPFLSLCSHFDLVIANDPADLATQDHLHDMLMEHVLNLAINHQCAEHLLHLPDLKRFLNVAASIEVELGENAAELLKAFYIASRKVRTSLSYATDIPIKALSSLCVCNVGRVPM